MLSTLTVNAGAIPNLTLPPDFLRKLGVQSGDELEMVVTADQVIFRPTSATRHKKVTALMERLLDQRADVYRRLA